MHKFYIKAKAFCRGCGRGDRKHHAKGYCSSCYVMKEWRKMQTVDKLEKSEEIKGIDSVS